jgi:hypothetical protein
VTDPNAAKNRKPRKPLTDEERIKSIAAIDSWLATIKSHEPHEWQQVGPCVYCVPCNIRLYQGTLPEDKKPPCAEHDWDYDSGMGFYYQCRKCGEMEWTE